MMAACIVTSIAMANNRLYLIDTETGDRILVAKGWSHWHWSVGPDDMTAWLSGRDIAASSGPDGAPSRLRLETE